MPAHMRFVDVLKVPVATVLMNIDVLKTKITGEGRNKYAVSPGFIYGLAVDSMKRREISIANYSAYRSAIDSYNPANSGFVTIPQEDWDLYFTKGSMFDSAIYTHFEDHGTDPSYTFTLILNHKKSALKRIEVTGPEVSKPSMIWVNGKGVFPNAEQGN